MQVSELATGALVSEPFNGHTGWVTAVGVAEVDNRPVVVSGSRDATVRIWEPRTGISISQPFTGHTRSISAVAVAELGGARW